MPDRWDVPSEKLRRIAATAIAPSFRECPSCCHRHAKGDLCGYQLRWGRTCACAV